MNPETADWSFGSDPDSTKKKKNMGQDNDLVELLWKNGKVVMHSQTNRKQSPSKGDAREQPQYRHDDPALRAVGSSAGNACNPFPDDEMASWIHCPIEDSFEKEFYSQFFGEFPTSNAMDVDKPIRQLEHGKAASNFGTVPGSSQQHDTRNANMVFDIPSSQMPPPRFQFPDPTRLVYDNCPGGSRNIINFSQFAPALKGSGVLSPANVREGSGMTVGSSRCGSNQILNEFPDQSHASSSGVGMAGHASAGMVKEDDYNMMSLTQTEGRKTEMLEPTLTSSSGGSGSSFGAAAKQGVDASIGAKRKGREGEEFECQSEALEIETSSGKKPTTWSSGSTRRSRAAEVHNLSERRRRDRINKKMKALQELIPHCNKTDKASMLDEAIEYLKSLQLQLQVMWMGGGMAPQMMFPGVQQHYMSSIGMTMCQPAMPSVQGNMHMPRIPMVDQSFPGAPTMSQGMFGQTPVLNPMNFQNQMTNPSFPEQFARYMAMHNIPTPQPANMFKFGRQGAQHNQTNSQPGSSSGRPADRPSNSKIGQHSDSHR